MLTHISIRNLATIETLHLTLSKGCTVVTGETGAGKSIFIEAIELALGGRASPQWIRSGQTKAEIRLCFDIAALPQVNDYLKQLDLDLEGTECIIRRILTQDGRSRCYVNDAPVTTQTIKELGEQLFHLHAQHAQHALMKPEFQRELLDRYAQHETLVDEVTQLADRGRSIQHQLALLQKKMSQSSERSDYLRYLLEELSTAELRKEEWESLEQEHRKLIHAETLRQHIQQSIQHIDEESTAVSSLHQARKSLDGLRNFDSKAEDWIHTLHAVTTQLEDLKSELCRYLEKIDIDEAEQLRITERFNQLSHLARKHKMPPQELIAYQERLTAELNALQTCDEDFLQLEQQQKQLEKKYEEAAEKLSTARKKASLSLAREMSTTLRTFALTHCEINIEFEKDLAAFAPCGREKPSFLIKINPGQPFQPLAKISGGELSRFSLAAHLALTHKTITPTLIFDEIDTGLSSATAEKIGKVLKQLGETQQVFVITHQAQVAVYGHHHIFAEKYVANEETHTRLRTLTETERTQEIARLLGGEKITEKTWEHAREMQELT